MDSAWQGGGRGRGMGGRLGVGHGGEFRFGAERSGLTVLETKTASVLLACIGISCHEIGGISTPVRYPGLTPLGSLQVWWREYLREDVPAEIVSGCSCGKSVEVSEYS